jgi:murein endopeptidase
VATGLEASRRRRLEAQAARRRRFTTRTVPAVALVVGSASMLSVSAFRQGGGGRAVGPLQVDPPSLPFRLDAARAGARSAKPAARTLARAAPAKVTWHRATSIGLPYSGRLVDGTQLPVEGPDWATWNPVTDSVPNEPGRLHGHERTIRAIISVAAAHRSAHPNAPPVLIGDISRRDGGTMDQHVSHQNGLDVDVYYPRLDRRSSAPIASSQVDRELAQDLLDRFLAAGAQVVFVGYATGLRGPGGLVVPYPNHENHMHVRFPSPG